MAYWMSPGIDAVIMGPNDLAYSMLRPGERIQGDPKQWSGLSRERQK
jgi:2-keto-3-deoxy-L-rhamnonate aldolase RhmA